MVPLNPLYTEFELEARLNDIDAGTAVVLNLWYPMVKRLQKKTSVRNVILAEFDDYTLPNKEKAATAVEPGDNWWPRRNSRSTAVRNLRAIHFEFRKDLPKTFVGKVLRRVLQDDEKGR